jgi:hypothetical protein
MRHERLQLALERLEGSHWALFERLASAFLSAEFDSLRTTATPSGDEGRDSELFSPEGEPSVVLQYSVAVDWSTKIRKTAKRLRETNEKANVLIYATNQDIGAKGDELRRELRKKYLLALDIRDQNWFLERVSGDARKEAAAEELAGAIVDPLLAQKGVSRAATELSTGEAVAALTYLALQWQDDIRGKGLTKLSFEALVRSVLLGTDSSYRLPRSTVKERIRALLPGHADVQVNTHTDAALRRLTKKAIRHWVKEDEFCLTHDEVQKLNDHLTHATLAEQELKSALRDVVVSILPEGQVGPDLVDQVADKARRVVERFLFERSQAFAIAVSTGQMKTMLAADDLRNSAIQVIGAQGLPKLKDVDWLAVLTAAAGEMLISPAASIQAHLRSLADSYTLLAFLKQTPDVQAAVEKMFSQGEVWLDTSVVLPLFAEELFEDGPGRFTRMVRAAREAGLALYVTSGVVEEVERHMNRSLAFARVGPGEWRGTPPYLVGQYLESGGSPKTLASWLDNYRGSERPLDDIADYLAEEFGIERRELADAAAAAAEPLRLALQSIWYEAHKRRRVGRKGTAIDELALTRLVSHDVECYSGIVQVRKQEKASPFGYSAWWLTLDQTAFELEAPLREALGENPPHSPVMSADFLVNYLAFGPVRRRVTKATEASLPVALEPSIVRYFTPELLEQAEKIRAELRDLPERVARRRVRDFVERAKRRLGPVARAGLRDLDADLIAS